MTDEQHEIAVNLANQLMRELKDIVDLRLQGANPEVEELTRTLLTEQARFWNGY